MFTPITLAVLRWIHDARERAALRRLLEKDDRLLDDMGLTRAEIQDVLSEPGAVNLHERAKAQSRLSLALDGRL
ncbi:MAG: DUF1127 domain-containing protein [Pseudomonadota bacterium]